LKRIAKREKKFKRMVMQATMQSQRNAVVHKFGVRLFLAPEQRPSPLMQKMETRSGKTLLHSSWTSLMSTTHSSTRACKPVVLKDARESIVILSLIANKI
jgi:hypothetical protein